MANNSGKVVCTIGQFYGQLPKLSIPEVLQIEFRRQQNGRSESMAICKDGTKKMYLCNVCNCVQYGDKNLISHIGGKKHGLFMNDIVNQILMPRRNTGGGSGGPNNNKNAQQKPQATNTNAKPQTTNPSTAKPQTTNASATKPPPSTAKPQTTNTSTAKPQTTNTSTAKPPPSANQANKTNNKTIQNSAPQKAGTTGGASTGAGAPKPNNNNNVAKPTSQQPINAAKKPIPNKPPNTNASTNSKAGAAPQKPANTNTQVKTQTPTATTKPPPATAVKKANVQTKQPAPGVSNKVTTNQTNSNNKKPAQAPATTKPIMYNSTMKPLGGAKPVATPQPGVKPTPVGGEKPASSASTSTPVKPSNDKKENAIPAGNTSKPPIVAPPKETSVVTSDVEMRDISTKSIDSSTEDVVVVLSDSDAAQSTSDQSSTTDKNQPAAAVVKQLQPLHPPPLPQRVKRNSQSNIVKNPLAAANSTQRKITLVPIEKLINTTESETVKEDDVIILDEEMPPATVILESKKNSSDKPKESNAKKSVESSASATTTNRKTADKPQQKAADSRAKAPPLPQPPAPPTITATSNAQQKSNNNNNNNHSNKNPSRRETTAPSTQVTVSTTTNQSQSTNVGAPSSGGGGGGGGGANISRNLAIRETGASAITFDSPPNPSVALGLLGVEYVIKIQGNRNRLRYECSLCEIAAGAGVMQIHLLGYAHRLKFCEKHFPTAIRQYRQFMMGLQENEEREIMEQLLPTLAIAIEKYHGRETTTKTYEHTYNTNRHDLFAQAYSRRHASEKVGPAFTHVIDCEQVQSLVANLQSYRAQNMQQNNNNMMMPFNEPQMYGQYNSYPGVVGGGCGPPQQSYYGNNYREPPMRTSAMDDETHKRMVENFLRDTTKSSPQRQQEQQRSSRSGNKRNRSRSPVSLSPSLSSLSQKRRRSGSLNSEWNAGRRSISPLRDGDIWQAYRHMVDQKVWDLNATFEMHKSDPESHPMYNEEWQKFWKRRKDELVAAGINHRTYNFQNEWVHFFNARIKELYNQNIENIKMVCRERLCLPMSNDELLDPKYHVHIVESAPPPIAQHKSKSHEQEIPEHHVVAAASRASAAPVQQQQQQQQHSTDINENASEINVIHVLRLLTALEEHMGSLGPTITGLLGKALQVDKLSPQKLNMIILTNENCMILETVKEKFIGLVISKLLDATKERAVKRAIQSIKLILELANELHKTPEFKNAQNEMNPIQVQNVLGRPNVSTIGSLGVGAGGGGGGSSAGESTDLAAKLASSLSSQVKTNFTRDELQKIIQVYSLVKRAENSATATATAAPSSSSSNIAASLTTRSQNNMNSSQYSSSTLHDSINLMDHQTSLQPSTSANIRQELSSARNRSNNDLGKSFNNNFSTNQAMSSNMNISNMNSSCNNTFSANMARNNSSNFNNNRNNNIGAGGGSNITGFGFGTGTGGGGGAVGGGSGSGSLAFGGNTHFGNMQNQQQQQQQQRLAMRNSMNNNTSNNSFQANQQHQRQSIPMMGNNNTSTLQDNQNRPNFNMNMNMRNGPTTQYPFNQFDGGRNRF